MAALLLFLILGSSLHLAVSAPSKYHPAPRLPPHRWPPVQKHSPPPPVRCGDGSVCQDPVLRTQKGEVFYFHGHKDADFCLVTDTDLHINAHFIGLRGFQKKRDFTWVQSLGILFGSNQLYIGARKVGQWNQAEDHLVIVLNSMPLDLPAEPSSMWRSPDNAVVVTRTEATNAVVVEVSGYVTLTVFVTPVTETENQVHGYGVPLDSDCMAHLDVSFQFHSLTAHVNGVLGQTYVPTFTAPKRLPGGVIPTVGGEDKFVTSGIMSPDCAVGRFHGAVIDPVRRVGDLHSVSCGSGNPDSGLVCRR